MYIYIYMYMHPAGPAESRHPGDLHALRRSQPVRRRMRLSPSRRTTHSKFADWPFWYFLLFVTVR